MRYGVLAANVGSYSDPRNVVRLALEAERAGWEALLIWDHLAFVWGPPAGDPWVTLAAVAASTSKLLIGTGVTPTPRRRPHVLAHQVATLDVLSGGRVIFGAGLGGVPSEFTAFGEDDVPRVRAEKLDESLDLLRRFWAGERVAHRGTYYEVNGVTLAPSPIQQPPRIWIGGNSSRARARAARFDGWLADTSTAEAMSVSPEELAELAARLPTGGGFDIVAHGHSDLADLRAYEAAGTTWWLEDVHDRRASFDELLRLVATGPPIS
jgi:alkanesulfonate monooxygenase SsuD/methylene tetrahydromethanopterin reductase-like flavin-dependent oxidoreductase (luciferase family)